MDLYRVVSYLRSVCDDISSLVEGTAVLPRMANRESLESMASGLELAYRELVAYEMLVGSSFTQQQSEALECVRAAMQAVRQATGEMYHETDNLHTGRGRPRVCLSREQLESLIEANFTVPQIAHMLGVSVSTIRRRMNMYNLAIRATYANISNEDLDQQVLLVSSQFPACGSKQMAGHLLSRGLRVQQTRIREALRRVDPHGVVMRQLTVMRRRHYSVPAPLSLYHVDGNHKLIRLSYINLLYYCCP